VAVLIDHPDVFAVVHRHDRHRPVVLDNFSYRYVAARHPHLVAAQRENVSGVQRFG
jgi:hypothetical protein